MKMVHFTIIIPTRERCETLPFAIQSCLSQNYPDFSVLVSDNFSNDSTEQIVKAIANPRLKYINPGRRLSMSSNFNFALTHIEHEGLVTCIGDDDALMPGSLVEAASIFVAYPDLPIACASVYYGWPGLPESSLANRLEIRDWQKRTVVRNAELVIRKRVTFKEYRDGYVWGLPGLYRGFVPTSMVRTGSADGRYLNSVTPDAYSAFLTALQAGQFVYTSRPMFVEGVSKKSNGAAQSFLTNVEEERKFISENDLPIHPSLTYCPAPSFVMVEAFLQVKDRFPGLAGALQPDMGRMCEQAIAETIPAKMSSVLLAVDELRARFKIHSTSKLRRAFEQLVRRLHLAGNQLRSVHVDCNSLGVSDVYGASLAAAAIWNYRANRGIVGGGSLLRLRISQFIRRRMGFINP